MLESGPLATGSGRLSERIGSAQVSVRVCSAAAAVKPALHLSCGVEHLFMAWLIYAHSTLQMAAAIAQHAAARLEEQGLLQRFVGEWDLQ